MKKLSHFDEHGKARMVDITEKPDTVRTAAAGAFVRIRADVLGALPQNPKGNPLEVARIAGIMAAKKTSDLIPMCHPIVLRRVDVEIREVEGGLELTSTVATTGPTGVEMEALTAVSVAALTIYDMTKALDKGIEIRDIRLLEKTGGKSGTWRRE